MSEQENNVGKWNDWYKDLPEQASAFNYGDTITYQLASEFLKDCSTVEDWGCGAGGFLRYRPDAVGVDGSDTRFAQKKFINLREYTSDVEGVHIRHIFEHNYNWSDILHNALKSAKKKLAITLFIPLDPAGTKQLAYNDIHGVNVPDVQINEQEFMDIITSYGPTGIERNIYETETGYGKEETIFITF